MKIFLVVILILQMLQQYLNDIIGVYVIMIFAVILLIIYW